MTRDRTWKPLEQHGEPYLNQYRLYRCPVCGGAVDEVGIPAHEEWHGELTGDRSQGGASR